MLRQGVHRLLAVLRQALEDRPARRIAQRRKEDIGVKLRIPITVLVMEYINNLQVIG